MHKLDECANVRERAYEDSENVKELARGFLWQKS